jgi:DNA (cytosine-5)-methyltransferase 1
MWTTPTARDYKSPDMSPDTKRLMSKTELNTAVSMFPTPTVNGNYNRKGAGPNSGDGLATMVNMYPTPTTGAGLCGGTGNFQQLQKLADNGTITEEERRCMSQGNGRSLNPDWVEVYLMGLPQGWTEV